MLKFHPSRTLLVERIILAFALAATAAYFVQKATVNYTFDYGFLSRPVYESRFEDLVQMLPAIGKAFYIPDPAADRSSEIALNRELMAKYCLAPYLSHDADSPFQIADFHRPVDLQQWAQDHHLELIRNFQDGIALFRKKGSP
jgi:hypothetical protein